MGDVYRDAVLGSLLDLIGAAVVFEDGVRKRCGNSGGRDGWNCVYCYDYIEGEITYFKASGTHSDLVRGFFQV